MDSYQDPQRWNTKNDKITKHKHKKALLVWRTTEPKARRWTEPVLFGSHSDLISMAIRMTEEMARSCKGERALNAML